LKIRILFSLILFTFIPAVVSGQSFYFGIGYDSFIPASGGFGKFADKYNTQRAAIITKKMESPASFSGVSFTSGLALGPLLMEMSYSSLKGSMSSELNPATTQGGASGREINISNSAINVTFGLMFGDYESEIYLVLPTIEGNFNSMDFRTRLTGINNNEVKGELSIISQLGFGAALMKGIANTFIIYGKVGYYLEPFESSYSDLYDKTATNYNLLSDEANGSYSGWLFKAGVMLYWNCLL